MLSDEIKKLFEKWDNNNGWPKRLEWVKIQGVRGWKGERVDFNFPIVAIVGETAPAKVRFYRQLLSSINLLQARKTDSHLTFSRTLHGRSKQALISPFQCEKARPRRAEA